MDSRLELLADVIIELVVREIETPLQVTRRKDNEQDSNAKDTTENMHRVPREILAG